MSKQTKPIVKDCQSRFVCMRPATWGVFRWKLGQTDINMDAPVRVFCGQHKPRLFRNSMLRNVKISRRWPFPWVEIT